MTRQAILSLACTLTLSLPLIPRSFAEDARPAKPAQTDRRPDPGARLDTFRQSLDDLKLTDEQKAKIDPLFDKAKSDIKEKVGDGSPRQRFEQVLPILRDLRTGIEDVLTPQQRETFQQKIEGFRSGQGTPGEGAGVGQRIEQVAAKLELTDDQKKQVEKILSDTRERMKDLASDPEKRREAAPEIFRSTMEKFRDVLTPDQQKKMMELLRNQQPALRSRAARPTTRPSASSDKDKKEAMMMEGDGEMMMAASAAKSGKKVAKSDSPTTNPLLAPISKTKPAALDIKKPDGKPFLMSTLNGKPTLLVFGSLTAPTLRDHAQQLEDLHRAFRNKVNFLWVYTREAYPTGGWEIDRNKDANVAVPPHKDEAARIAQAKAARAQLNMTIPLAVDSMDDSAVRTYDTFPNGCVLLDRDGNVVLKQKWTNPDSLKPLLEDAVSKNATAARSDG